MRSMADSDKNAAKGKRGDSVFSPIPILIIVLGGYATLATARGAWNLLLTYGGL